MGNWVGMAANCGVDKGLGIGGEPCIHLRPFVGSALNLSIIGFSWGVGGWLCTPDLAGKFKVT